MKTFRPADARHSASSESSCTEIRGVSRSDDMKDGLEWSHRSAAAPAVEVADPAGRTDEESGEALDAQLEGPWG